MKTIITLAAALIALASPAQAQEPAIRIENDGGGYITLTTRGCTLGDEVYKNLRTAVATGPRGNPVYGCGGIMRDKVVIVWSVDGAPRKEYPLEAFTVVPTNSKDTWL